MSRPLYAPLAICIGAVVSLTMSASGSGSDGTQTPSPTPTPTSATSPSDGSATPAPACAKLSNDFGNIQSDLFGVEPTSSPSTAIQATMGTTTGQSLGETSPATIAPSSPGAAALTADTISRATKLHYYVLPVYFGSGFSGVESSYTSANTKILATLKDTTATVNDMFVLNPQLSQSQRQAATALITAQDNVIEGLATLNEQAVALKRAVPGQNFFQITQLALAGLNLHQAAQGNANVGLAGLLGSGTLQTFIDEHSIKLEDAYTAVTNPATSIEVQIAGIVPAMANWVDACSPQSPQAITVYPASISLDKDNQTQTIVVSENDVSSFKAVSSSADTVTIALVELPTPSPTTTGVSAKSKGSKSGGAAQSGATSKSTPTPKPPTATNAFIVKLVDVNANPTTVTIVVADALGHIALVPVAVNNSKVAATSTPAAAATPKPTATAKSSHTAKPTATTKPSHTAKPTTPPKPTQ